MTNYVYSSAMFLNVRNATVLLILILNPQLSFSQNLIPNPSFEILDTCPSILGQIENAIGWKAIMLSPDYFNRCAIGWPSLPDNAYGQQEPIKSLDNGYAGILTASDIDNYREMIGISILSPLEIGSRYYFSFDYASGFNDLSFVHINCFTSHLGMKLVVNFSDTNNLADQLINDTAFLYSERIFSDTSNWNSFSGSFIADSSYSFLIIGNFFHRSSIITTCNDSTDSYPFVYIDNVCLSQLKNHCFKEIDSSGISDFTVYPTVGNGLIKVKTKLLNIDVQILVYNYIGQLIKQEMQKGGEFEIDLQSFAKGVYLLCIDNFTFKIIII